jgi:hypothetical protein
LLLLLQFQIMNHRLVNKKETLDKSKDKLRNDAREVADYGSEIEKDEETVTEQSSPPFSTPSSTDARKAASVHWKVSSPLIHQSTHLSTTLPSNPTSEGTSVGIRETHSNTDKETKLWRTTNNKTLERIEGQIHIKAKGILKEIHKSSMSRTRKIKIKTKLTQVSNIL